MTDTRKKQTVRNLVIFAVVSVSIGWIGLGLNRVMATAAPGQNLGMLLWLIVPALTGLLLRAVAGDGWSDAGLRPALKKNLGWYGFALLIYPACIALVLGLGYATGAVSFAGLASVDQGTFLGLIAAAVLAGFVKNIFEEFAWRGYLTPRLDSLGWVVRGEFRAGRRDLGSVARAILVWFPGARGFQGVHQPESGGVCSTDLCGLYPGRLRLRGTAAGHGVGLADRRDAHRGQCHHLDAASEPPDRVQERIGVCLFTPGMEGLLVMVLWTLIGVGIYRRRKASTTL